MAGIGTDDVAEADYYVMTDPQLNTFDPDQIPRITERGVARVERVIKMPLLNINRVFEEQFAGKAPDLISIDVEGLDFAILKTLNFSRYRPKIICVETLITFKADHNPETAAFMASQGYRLMGLTFANSIFVEGRLVG
jgi:hypothetical protein